MVQTFESLKLDIEHNIRQSLTPIELTSILQDMLHKAEQYEEKWLNDLYERSNDDFESFIY
jgi:hypothetical protein